MSRNPSHGAAVALVAVITTGALLAAAVPATATSPDDEELARRTAALIERATGGPAKIPMAALDTAVGRQQSAKDEHGGPGVLVPQRSDQPVEVVSAGESVRIGLPAGGAGRSVPGVDTGFTVVYPKAGVRGHVGVQATGAGARAVVTLDDATAPREYRYPVQLPRGARLARTEDGSILAVRGVKNFDRRSQREEDAARANGDGKALVGLFDVPWAKDAHGRPVPTSYRVEGSTIVQSVRPHRATAFPVVADPVWIVPVALLIGRVLLMQGIRSFSRHALTRMAQRGISKEMVAHAVKVGRKSAGRTPGTTKYSTKKFWVVVNREGNVVSVGWK